MSVNFKNDTHRGKAMLFHILVKRFLVYTVTGLNMMDNVLLLLELVDDINMNDINMYHEIVQSCLKSKILDTVYIQLYVYVHVKDLIIKQFGGLQRIYYVTIIIFLIHVLIIFLINQLIVWYFTIKAKVFKLLVLCSQQAKILHFAFTKNLNNSKYSHFRSNNQ